MSKVKRIEVRSERWNARLVTHHEVNGHGDGMRLLKAGRYVYIAHLGTSPMAPALVDVSIIASSKLMSRIEWGPP